MHRIFSTLILLPLFLSAVASAASSFRGDHLKVSLLTTHSSVQPGQAFHLGLHFEIEKGWHIYWKNPGDSGAAPKASWKAEGAKVGSILWPSPRPLPLSEILNYGYTDTVTLPVPIVADTKFTGKPEIVVDAELEWLVCKIECLPGFANLEQKIRVGKSVQVRKGQPIIDAIAEVPSRTGAPAIKTINATQEKIELEISSAEDIKEVYFFPMDSQVISNKMPEITSSGSTIRLNASLNPNRPEVDRTTAVITVVDQNSLRSSYEIDVLLLKARPWLIGMIFFAFIGGVILNLMPCVFPVLSIKVLSFMGPNKNKEHLRKAGWAYSAGVVSSFLFLGALLTALRAAGESLGWGFQLQSPWIVAVLILLFVAIGLNLLGLFEVGEFLTRLQLPSSLASSNSMTSAFATGLLATFVATPCTAPFMGAALGYTLTQPALISLIIFGTLGVGMAFPFLLLTYSSQLLAKLPRSGPWLLRFKQVLSVPMFLTAIWLGWILAQQVFATTTPHNDNWKKFSTVEINELRKQKKPYFLDFTASWCITCQVNKKVVLDTADIQKLFVEKNVPIYVADWTSRDPEVTQALEERGRNSLPLYVYYDPAKDRETVLPEILTKQMIFDLLK